MVSALISQLKENPARLQLTNHFLFEAIDQGIADRNVVFHVLGQWWHPLHYFPDFMSGAVLAMPSIEAKCFLANILNEETGAGVADDAHERLFIKTAENAGFSEKEIMSISPTPETQALVDGYRDSTKSAASVLGFVYGTETVDLLMVSKMEQALRIVAPDADLPWVDIHVSQEPNHVAQVNRSVDIDFSPQERVEFVAAAESLWNLWSGMFTSAVRSANGRLAI